MERIQSPRTDDSAIEAEIKAKGKTAPRVTPDSIKAVIVSEHYFTAAEGATGADVAKVAMAANGKIENHIFDDCHETALHLLTFCVLVLQNGFTVTGKSACASPENFDADIGRKVAFGDAFNQIWPLEGYLLKQRLHDAACEYALLHGEVAEPVTIKAPIEPVQPAVDPDARMCFSGALLHLKGGACIARAGWNGRGMFVYMVPANAYPAQTSAAKAHFGDGALVPYRAYLALVGVDGAVSTWAPSVGDTLAEDWTVVQVQPL